MEAKELIKNEKGSGGIGFFGLLAILLIGLKLTGYIDLSWFWVTMPIWGGFTSLFILIFLALLLKRR